MGSVPKNEGGGTDAQTAEIIDFPGATIVPLDPKRILQEAVEFELTEVLIIGRDQNGDPQIWMSDADIGLNLWLMELCKKKMMEEEDE